MLYNGLWERRDAATYRLSAPRCPAGWSVTMSRRAGKARKCWTFRITNMRTDEAWIPRVGSSRELIYYFRGHCEIYALEALDRLVSERDEKERTNASNDTT